MSLPRLGQDWFPLIPGDIYGVWQSPKTPFPSLCMLPALRALSLLGAHSLQTARSYGSTMDVLEVHPPRKSLANDWRAGEGGLSSLASKGATLRWNLHTWVPWGTGILCPLWPRPLPSCFPQSLSCPGLGGVGGGVGAGREGALPQGLTQPGIPVSVSASGELHLRHRVSTVAKSCGKC